MGDILTIKAGDFQIITLNRRDPMNPAAVVHMAFVRYNGTHPGPPATLVFEIGLYDGNKKVQSGSPHYHPANKKMLDCRVDTYGHRVELELTSVSPLEIKARDMTEKQTAIRD